MSAFGHRRTHQLTDIDRKDTVKSKYYIVKFLLGFCTENVLSVWQFDPCFDSRVR